MPELKFVPGSPGTMSLEGFVLLTVPELGVREWEYVRECLESNWVSSVGPFVDRFEEAVAASVGARHAVATVNGTAALHVALLVAGVEPDDEVLVSTLSFIAPANAVRYVGAWPVFVDAEPNHWQMDPDRVARFLDEGCRWTNGRLINKTTGRRVKALVPVHVLGHPVNLDPINEVARKYELVVVEDAAESIGARYKDRNVGQLGDLACFSFNGNKVVTTGGGGMVVCNDPTLAGRARYLTTQAKDDPLEYVHRTIGYNYRLTNILAALGCAQLERLDDYVAAKRRIAGAYAEALQNVAGLTLMREADWAASTYWMSTVQVDEREYGLSSRDLMRRLHAARIQTRPLWQPLHQSAAHAGCMALGGEVSERLHRECLSLPSSAGLSREDQGRVIDALTSTPRPTAR